MTSRPPLAAPAGPPPVPRGVRDLSTGNPDPALLPALGPALRRLDTRHRLYDEPPILSELRTLAAGRLGAEGVPTGALTIVNGALDGVQRVLQAHLRPGDRVAVEDPAYAAILQLLGALGLAAEPVAVDQSGPRPDHLERALRSGAGALIVTPRAQNPTGAFIDRERAGELRAVLDQQPDVLVIEDDHQGPVSGSALAPLSDPDRSRWAFVHSVSKSLGPDLRLAVVAGDPVTVGRVEGRLLIGPGWVSGLLQQTVHALWSTPATDRLLQRAARTYAARRETLIQALAQRGVPAWGRSGMNVWIPVAEESRTAQALLEAGWAVRAGEPYRIRTGPAVRVTTATLQPEEADGLADGIALAVAPARRSRSA